MDKVIIAVLIALSLVFAYNWSTGESIKKLQKEELELAIAQRKLEIRYLTLQLELIDDSAGLSP